MIKDSFTKCLRKVVPNLFGTRNWFCGRQFFHGLGKGLVWGLLKVHYISCALYFCYLLHQLHFRSSGIRSHRLGTPALEHLWPSKSQPNAHTWHLRLVSQTDEPVFTLVFHKMPLGWILLVTQHLDMPCFSLNQELCPIASGCWRTVCAAHTQLFNTLKRNLLMSSFAKFFPSEISGPGSLKRLWNVPNGDHSISARTDAGGQSTVPWGPVCPLFAKCRAMRDRETA